MPAQRGASHQTLGSNGSFLMRASLHNRDHFSTARDDPSRPYPAYEEVYLHSNMSNPGSDEFQDLGLNNFLVAQRRVARRKLERLQLTPYCENYAITTLFSPLFPLFILIPPVLGMTLNCIIMLSQQLGRYVERIHSQDTPILAIICELVGPSHEGVSPQGPPLPVDDYGRFRLPTTRDVLTAIERHLYDDVTTQMRLTLGSSNDNTPMLMPMFSSYYFSYFLCLPFYLLCSHIKNRQQH